MSDPETDETPEEPPVKRRAGKVVGRALLVAVLMVVAFGAGIGVLMLWAQGVHNAPGPHSQQVTVVIEPGSGLTAISRGLDEAGVLTNREVFVAMLRYGDQHTRLKAGEYALPPGVSQAEIARMLIENRVVERSITIPEGLTVVEVLALIEAAEALEGDVGSPPPQGSLLPETYRYRRGETRSALIERMQAAMRETLADLWEARAPDLPLKAPEEALVLASIIEKETGVASERERVAAVFVNRLRKPMRLQSDPTVVFALTEGKAPLGRTLTRRDWKVDHPYNTYRIDGLPPGPIANPGRAAIEAALNPATTKELYFVADGSGGHAFAETLAEHNRNVAKWRRIRDAQ